jgi:AmmeMemoRadiSam system protein A/AmmeMemoRadiSam system protein B
MSIIAAFVLPHPPIIIPEIGQGEENQVAATLKAYNKVAQDIAALKPDTIVISSPHAEAYSNYFQFSDGEVATGSFARFRAPQVSFRVFYDKELTQKIALYAKSEDFPAGYEGEEDPSLTNDHGTMVPLYFINKYYRNYKLVRLGLSGLPLVDHYHMGQIIKTAVNSLGRRVVYIASGDLSHCQKADGPYGFNPAGPKYDEQLMKSLKQGSFGDLFLFDSNLMEKAQECGHRSFVIMAGALDRTAIKPVVLSHEATFGVGYGIAEYFVEGNDPSRAYRDLYLAKQAFSIRQKQMLEDPYVRLARQSIEAYVSAHRTVKSSPLLPEEMMKDRAGVFVSIHENGELRGCIGTTSPLQSCIADEIIANAISACSQDPRFSPVTSDELPYLSLSVDVLSPYEQINSPKQLDVHKYGVIVEKGTHRGLLLPNLDGVDTVAQQIQIAKRKAGIPDEETVTLYRFEVKRHS